jgi:alkylhydroperoxidase family enzyme
MSRLQFAPPEQYEPLFGVDADTPGKVHSNAPGLARLFLELSAGIREEHRTLSGRLIELVRLRIAFHNQCRSCMAIRYSTGLDDGLTEDLVCSLERPQEAEDLTAAERAALAYADLMATNHLGADDAMFDRLRQYFTEPQIVELGYNCALYVGFGRMAATWDMHEDLPERFQERSELPITPWGEGELIRG